MLTTEVENFPSTRTGSWAHLLIDSIRQQALRFGTTVISPSVTQVELKGDVKNILLGEGGPLRAKSVIIATGATALSLGLESEGWLLRHSVSTCAPCDAYLCKDCDVVVVDGGDSSIEEALLLAKLGARVTVIHRREQLRASHIMQQRALASDSISFAWNGNATVHDILGSTPRSQCDSDP
jgi:thioredoxin reductase (NADPH)